MQVTYLADALLTLSFEAVVDPEFLEVGAPTSKVDVKSYYLANYCPKNCTKFKKFGPQRELTSLAPVLNPLMLSSRERRERCVTTQAKGSNNSPEY